MWIFYTKVDCFRSSSFSGARANNTLIYTQLINFEGDEYHSATAKTVEEARQLIEAGFEYVCEMENCELFRKRN